MRIWMVGVSEAPRRMGLQARDRYLSKTWKTCMPKTATVQLMRAVMTMPTTIVMLPLLTADRICPAMMQLIVPYPTMMIIFSTHVIFPGQYPMKYLVTICGVQHEGSADGYHGTLGVECSRRPCKDRAEQNGAHHGSIATLCAPNTGIRYHRGPKQATPHSHHRTIHKPQVEKQWPQKSNSKIVCSDVCTEPKNGNVHISKCRASMALLWHHTRDATRFQASEALNSCIPVLE